MGVEIINEGAPGGSINRMIRKTYEYIIKNKRSLKETLFIFEIPPGWRDEYYSNELKRYVNMTIGNICSPSDQTDAANGNDPNDIYRIHKDISNFFYGFVDDELHKTKTMLSLLGLMSYIKFNKLNYILNDTGDFDTFLYRNNLDRNYNFIWFSEKFEYPMWQWATEKKLLVKHETNGLSNDEHMGIEANELMATKLYNFLNVGGDKKLI